jgi:hypothetical protein
MHAPEQAQPANHQAFTVCFAMGYDKDADRTIEKPENYAFWRDYVPESRPNGRANCWIGRQRAGDAGARTRLRPDARTAAPGRLNLWIYRRIVRARILSRASPRKWCHASSTGPRTTTWPGNLYDGTGAENARHLEGAGN